MESIVTALITGGLALLGVVYTSAKSARAMSDNMDANLDKHQAVTDTNLDELTREVRAHNNFAQRVPVLEEQMKVVNHRMQDLERRE